MKKSFSTLGCPTWKFNEVVSVAKDIGMDGIEIRGLGYQMYAPKLDIFNEKNIDKTLALLNRVELEIPMLTSGCDLSNEDFDKCLNEAQDYINLAQKIKTPYIRIMCESSPQPKRNIDIEIIAKRYAQICDIAKSTSVKPLIETNSCLANSDNMLKFLELTSRENIGILWDLHHPYRFFDEPIKQTFNKLKDYICYVHLKDSIVNNGKVEYRIMGHGDIPIKEALYFLKDNGYSGYLSLEWVKRWCPDIEESGIAFPQYANYIDDLF